MKIILSGIIIESVGLVLDILHHLQIGIKTTEGLLTVQHAIILIGFLINFVGVFIVLFQGKDK